MKFARIVPQVNMRQLTELHFRFSLTSYFQDGSHNICLLLAAVYRVVQKCGTPVFNLR